ncbi:MAG: hypothetical protein FWH40_08255, partial [Coriobacteriia bacterium]|nr:hypothetical protein [Coriobacteriia bacterium]
FSCISAGFADDVWCVYPGYAIFLLCGAMSLRIYPRKTVPYRQSGATRLIVTSKQRKTFLA